MSNLSNQRSANKLRARAVLAALDALAPAALAGALAAEIAEVDAHFGDAAFDHDRLAIVIHEASHGTVAHHENITIDRIEIYRVPQPAVSAIGVAGTWMGKILARETHRVTADSDPRLDLSWARYLVAGRVGGLLHPSGRQGHGLDVHVMAQAITRVAAVKLDIDDTDALFNQCVVDPTRRVLRANWFIVLELARKLDNDGVAYATSWRRELLGKVRRIDAGAPERSNWVLRGLAGA